MSFESLTVAVCQMTSTDKVENNFLQMKNLIAQIPEEAGVRLAVFPENALYLRLREGEKISGISLEDSHLAKLAELAKFRQMHLHLTTPVRLDGDLYNSSVHISETGEVEATYQKIHLFDITLEKGPSVRESDVFKSGDGAKILEIDGWRIGESICYDLRFAELFSIYAKAKVDAVLIPSSFLVKTGEAHWDVLMRARAVENQCYVLAPAQSGTHKTEDHAGQRETYGNSLIVDPWGTVISRLGDRGPGVSIAVLRRSEIEKVRRQIPMADHRRLPF